MKRYRIVTADKNAGKTTYIKKLIEADDNAIGFISEKESGDYYLLNIRTGERVILLSDRCISSIRFRHWYVNEDAFLKALNYLKSNIKADSSVYIDEVGRMEAEGRGFYDILNYIAQLNSNLTIAIRSEFIDLIKTEFIFLKDAEILSVPKS